MNWLLWWRPPCVLREVIVNLLEDENTAIRGVLWRSRGAWLTLKRAEILKVSLPPSPVDGDLVIHRDRVSFIQVLPS